VLSGLSAGAICWFNSGCSAYKRLTNSEPELAKINALNFVPALYCPHYNSDPERKAKLKEIMRETTEIALAFDDCCAIEIVDNEYRILASNKTANAYRVFWKNGMFQEEIIEKKDTYSPIDELLKK
jgi:dipeptidase E